MDLKDFYYDLPKELIAQEPLKNREMSRLMLVNKKTGEISHDIFKSIIKYLNSGDCLVLNNTRVIPARLFGQKDITGTLIEVLLLNRIEKGKWEVILKPGKRAKRGTRIIFGNGELIGTVIEVKDNGNRIISFEYIGIFEEILDRLGEMPLPPYITKKLMDKERYQTVYSKHEGSAAAPTAGLHFTEELLEDIRKKGINIAFLTLHVGLGTFRPVKEQNIENHKMHSEFYILNENTAHIINETKKAGNRIIAVGTTGCRTLETLANEDGFIKGGSGWTDIFIYPGYKFKIVDSLITNINLPQSTFLMLVSSICGRENILNAYKEAINKRYRFFSFGDAMMIQ